MFSLRAIIAASRHHVSMSAPENPSVNSINFSIFKLAVRGIPFDKPKIAAAYSLAAQFLGMRFVYLEAGSGAAVSVEPEMVKTVRKVFKGFLIVGGGIRDAKTAKNIVKAGADALVIGTLLENKGSLKKLTEITKTIRNIKR